MQKKKFPPIFRFKVILVIIMAFPFFIHMATYTGLSRMVKKERKSSYILILKCAPHLGYLNQQVGATEKEKRKKRDSSTNLGDSPGLQKKI